MNDNDNYRDDLNEFFSFDEGDEWKASLPEDHPLRAEHAQERMQEFYDAMAEGLGELGDSMRDLALAANEAAAATQNFFDIRERACASFGNATESIHALNAERERLHDEHESTLDEVEIAICEVQEMMTRGECTEEWGSIVLAELHRERDQLRSGTNNV